MKIIRVNNLGFELVNIQEQIAKLSNSKKKKLILEELNNRLVEIKEELFSLGYFLDERGYLANEFNAPALAIKYGKMSFVTWAGLTMFGYRL